MKISPLAAEDLDKIKALQPPDWEDITPHLAFYVRSPLCHPLKISEGDAIVAAGSTIVHGSTAWLAHILVHPEYRNRGLGTLITKSLIESVTQTGLKTILLIATPLGAFVYKKLGFLNDCEYLFFRGEHHEQQLPERIYPFEEKHTRSVLEMDKKIYGEDRSRILGDHLAGAKLCFNGNELSGFYLPTFYEGLVVAADEYSGIDLLRLRLSKQPKIAVPEKNETAIRFLLDNGYSEFRRGQRMWLGENVRWFPQNIYSRVSGSLG